MADDTQKVLARLEHEGAHALELAGLYARTLESLAQRIQGAAASGAPADKSAMRSAALRLEHAANEGLAALVSVIVQSARLDMLATVRKILEDERRKDPV
ncbi:MAG TPA: hypothetical protein VER04_04320 [Polyangiaceae bacterium]|nr:hypothetical protein [Polyangiaceae bacterium]